MMSIEEGKEMQEKRMHNIFNKKITENFSNLEKTTHIQVQETFRTPNRGKPVSPQQKISTGTRGK
jgi:hypothetical protein